MEIVPKNRSPKEIDEQIRKEYRQSLLAVKEQGNPVTLREKCVALIRACWRTLVESKGIE